MRQMSLLSAAIALICVAVPIQAKWESNTDSDYLQRRAASLNTRIDAATKKRKLSNKAAAELHLLVGQVQALAGNLQARNGTIDRSDADKMNQKLTDVERTLTGQPN